MITQDGSVKLKSELDPADTATHPTPPPLTVGHASAVCPGGGLGAQEIHDISSLASLGSYSPTGLTGGANVLDIIDNAPTHCMTYTALSDFSVAISQNPGSSWSTQFGLSSRIGKNVSCSVVHNRHLI